MFWRLDGGISLPEQLHVHLKRSLWRCMRHQSLLCNSNGRGHTILEVYDLCPLLRPVRREVSESGVHSPGADFFEHQQTCQAKKRHETMNFQWSLQLIDGKSILDRHWTIPKSKAHQCRWVLRKVTVSLWVSFFLQKSSLDPWSLPPLACRQCERCCLKGLRILQQYDLWVGNPTPMKYRGVSLKCISVSKKTVWKHFSRTYFCFGVMGPLILSHSLDPVWNLDRWTLRHLYPPPPRKNV